MPPAFVHEDAVEPHVAVAVDACCLQIVSKRTWQLRGAVVYVNLPEDVAVQQLVMLQDSRMVALQQQVGPA
jgi:hypothetical protein